MASIRRPSAELLGGLERHVSPPMEVVVGDPAAPATAALTGEIRPRRVAASSRTYLTDLQFP
jgi:hypothetical protein